MLCLNKIRCLQNVFLLLHTSSLWFTEPLAESEEENTNPDIVPEPPDIICSVLKVPDIELGKRTSSMYF